MEQTNPRNPIDVFLESLNVEVEQSTPQPDKYKVRVMLSTLDNKYYLNCFILNQVTSGQLSEKDFPGQLTQGQYTFDKTTLADICEKVEKGLDSYEIFYHSSIPVKPGPGHNIVSYQLLHPQNDPYSDYIRTQVRQMVDNLYSGHNKWV